MLIIQAWFMATTSSTWTTGLAQDSGVGVRTKGKLGCWPLMRKDSWKERQVLSVWWEWDCVLYSMRCLNTHLPLDQQNLTEVYWLSWQLEGGPDCHMQAVFSLRVNQQGLQETGFEPCFPGEDVISLLESFHRLAGSWNSETEDQVGVFKLLDLAYLEQGE